jgi:hypothetical protein
VRKRGDLLPLVAVPFFLNLHRLYDLAPTRSGTPKNELPPLPSSSGLASFCQVATSDTLSQLHAPMSRNGVKFLERLAPRNADPGK